MCKKKSVFSVLIFFMLSAGSNLIPNKLTFGSKVDSVTSVELSGKKVTVPQSNTVNVLFFFNVSINLHHKAVAQLDLLYQDSLKSGKNIKFFAVSNGKPQQFRELLKKCDIKIHLINDTGNVIHTMFNFTCDHCQKLVVIDKTQTVRYNATHLDLYFLKRVIDRYSPDR